MVPSVVESKGRNIGLFFNANSAYSNSFKSIDFGASRTKHTLAEIDIKIHFRQKLNFLKLFRSIGNWEAYNGVTWLQLPN